MLSAARLLPTTLKSFHMDPRGELKESNKKKKGFSFKRRHNLGYATRKRSAQGMHEDEKPTQSVSPVSSLRHAAAMDTMPDDKFSATKKQ